MKKVCVVGHFGFGKNLVNGQTIKTKTVSEELEKQLGVDQVEKIDTHGGLFILPIVLIRLVKDFKRCKNIIIMPAHNGVKVFVPLCVMLNYFFHRKLHYIVIGGWLPVFLDKHVNLVKCLKRFNYIYVETKTMKNALVNKGLSNVIIMQNFKKLNILSEKELVYSTKEPLALCTFSRVMKEKGIETAVRTVEKVNDLAGRTVYKLDIYGQVDNKEQQWFEELKNTFPPYISYLGVVSYDKSVDVLKNYFALVFPTHFYTEGIPGTIIDAYAAGLPVISSKWESFSDVVDEGVTGFGYDFNNIEELVRILTSLYEYPDLINLVKLNCINKANEYSLDEVIKKLIERL